MFNAYSYFAFVLVLAVLYFLSNLFLRDYERAEYSNVSYPSGVLRHVTSAFKSERFQCTRDVDIHHHEELLEKYTVIQSEVQDQTKQHSQLAIAQQELSKSFKGFHDMAASLTRHLEDAGQALVERQHSIAAQQAGECEAASSVLEAPVLNVTCPPVDYTDLYRMLESKDAELERIQMSVSMVVQDLHAEFERVLEKEQEESAILRQRIAELEQSLVNSKDQTRQIEAALLKCATVDEMRQVAIDMAADLRSSLPVAAITTPQPSANADMVCFENLEQLEGAIRDVVIGMVMPRMSQLMDEQFHELSVIHDQVVAYLEMHESRKVELAEAKAHQENMNNCLIEQDLRTIVSNIVSRDCSSITTASLGIDKLVQEARTTLSKANRPLTFPPDHAQRGAGGEVVHSLTSPTFSRAPTLQAESEKSGIVNAKIAAEYVWDTVSQLFYAEDGIGKPEEAISHKVTLGQCWAMRVCAECALTDAVLKVVL